MRNKLKLKLNIKMESTGLQGSKTGVHSKNQKNLAIVQQKIIRWTKILIDLQVLGDKNVKEIAVCFKFGRKLLIWLSLGRIVVLSYLKNK